MCVIEGSPVLVHIHSLTRSHKRTKFNFMVFESDDDEQWVIENKYIIIYFIFIYIVIAFSTTPDSLAGK